MSDADTLNHKNGMSKNAKIQEEGMFSRTSSTMQDLLYELGVDEPMRWPIEKKLYATLASFGYCFALLYGASSYTVGVQGVMKEFNVSMTKAILPFSLYIWGIFFAPWYAPHVSERMGRNKFYVVATIGLAVFSLGAGYSRNYTQLAICRFFAGFFGGSNAVQVEGSFADVWPALYTSSYYSYLAATQYFGAATGAVICWHIIPPENWRWTQYTTCMFCLAALLLGFGAPESYRRLLVRQRAKQLNIAADQDPPPTGTTVARMAQLTLTHPVKLLITQPVVIMLALYLSLNFGVLFSWFVLVPIVLKGVAGFTPAQVGLAFTSAIGGTACAAISTTIIDQISVRYLCRRKEKSFIPEIEHRMIPAIFGACMLTASLFWIGWTANPHHHPYVPIIGTAFYVWGSMMTLIGFISYLFDAFSPQKTLSGLTAVACSRIAFAGLIPLLIIKDVTKLGGAWALSTFGFISIAFLPFPIIILIWGKKLRSLGTDDGDMSQQVLKTQVETYEKAHHLNHLG